VSIHLTQLVWKTELNLLPSEHHVLLCLAYFANDKKDLLCCPKISTIAHRCHLSPRQTIRILRQLCEMGIITKISYKDTGIDTNSNNYLINEAALKGEIPEIGSDMLSLPRCQDVTSSGDMVSHNKYIDNNTSNKKENIKRKDGQSDTREPEQSPSSVLLDTAKRVIDFLKKKTGRKYQYKDTTLKHILQRLKEGATELECKQVIIRKHRDWGHLKDMEKYLRPSTLFRKENFESKYLPECVSEVEKKEIMDEG
jgi:uncharacterized phage protein (TIGR02220 family)